MFVVKVEAGQKLVTVWPPNGSRVGTKSLRSRAEKRGWEVEVNVTSPPNDGDEVKIFGNAKRLMSFIDRL